MEKQSNNGRKPPTVPKKLPKERVFGANAVNLSEIEANNLIGGILEKGIIDNNFSTPPSSSPLPSLLPFPVARHRSHGPLPVVGLMMMMYMMKMMILHVMTQ